jgi:hypothetical protein
MRVRYGVGSFRSLRIGYRAWAAERHAEDHEGDATQVGSARQLMETSTPINVAVAGSRATNRAYVARGRRAIASWSNTYGITDDEMPTAAPAARATGSRNACAADRHRTG